MIPDLLVVGGGVIGLCIADEALRHGLRVTILDKGALGKEASWAGAGMLTCRPRPKHGSGHDYHDLAQLSTRLHKAWAARLKEDTGIDVGYRECGALELLTAPLDDAEQQQDVASLLEGAKTRGVRCRQIAAADACRLEPQLAAHFTGALEYPDEAQIRNPRFLRALIADVKRRGATVLENTAAADLVIAVDRIEGVRLASGETLAAKNVAVCAGPWAGQLPALVKVFPAAAKVHPVRGQLLRYEVAPDFATRLLTCDHNYIVPRGDGVLLIGATQEKVGFEKEITEDATALLRDFAVRILPVLSTIAPVQSWAGLRPGLSGRHPIIGQVPGVSGLHVALGHHRNGLSLSTATAELLVSALVAKIPEISLGAWSPVSV